MNKPFLPFSKPTIDQNMINEVVDCMQSGWLATGPRVEKFSQSLIDYLSAKNIAMMTSCTAALQLAFKYIGIKPGDEVITTPMTFVATANTIEMNGAKPVFVDIEKDTYNIDVNKIEAAITERTRAIAPVHFAGAPVDLDPVYAIAKKYNLRVVEDAAEAIGTEYKGKRIGSFGDIQTFSFHPNKTITTAEGGCITTPDAELIQKVQRAVFHGINKKATELAYEPYDVPEFGFKYNMLDIQAAIGIHQLARIEEFIEKRKYLAERYKKLLAEFQEWSLPKLPSYAHKHSWYMFNPLLNSSIAGIGRNEFIPAMKKEGIGVGMHFPAVHLLSYYRNKYHYKKGDFPIAEEAADRIVSLPLFPLMSDQDQDRVIDAMKKVFRRK